MLQSEIHEFHQKQMAAANEINRIMEEACKEKRAREEMVHVFGQDHEGRHHLVHSWWVKDRSVFGQVKEALYNHVLDRLSVSSSRLIEGQLALVSVNAHRYPDEGKTYSCKSICFVFPKPTLLEGYSEEKQEVFYYLHTEF